MIRYRSRAPEQNTSRRRRHEKREAGASRAAWPRTVTTIEKREGEPPEDEIRPFEVLRLSSHARITSHWLRGPCGAGTRAGRVPTHRDACRACSKARPEESGRGRLRVCATTVAEKLFLRGLLGRLRTEKMTERGGRTKGETGRPGILDRVRRKGESAPGRISATKR